MEPRTNRGAYSAPQDPQTPNVRARQFWAPAPTGPGASRGTIRSVDWLPPSCRVRTIGLTHLVLAYPRASYPQRGALNVLTYSPFLILLANPLRSFKQPGEAIGPEPNVWFGPVACH